MIYFDRLLDLLQLERTYDRESYRLLIENTGINERRLQGGTWYPVAIKDTEPAYGDYINVVLERTSFQDINHSFRSGASVVLFSGHHPEERRIEGIVSFQSGNRIRINLRTDELPEWTREGKLGIDLLFDENSYEEMEKALKRAAKVDLDTDLGRLIRVCTGD